MNNVLYIFLETVILGIRDLRFQYLLYLRSQFNRLKDQQPGSGFE